ARVRRGDLDGVRNGIDQRPRVVARAHRDIERNAGDLRPRGTGLARRRTRRRGLSRHQDLETRIRSRQGGGGVERGENQSEPRSRASRAKDSTHDNLLGTVLRVLSSTIEPDRLARRDDASGVDAVPDMARSSRSHAGNPCSLRGAGRALRSRWENSIAEVARSKARRIRAGARRGRDDDGRVRPGTVMQSAWPGTRGDCRFKGIRGGFQPWTLRSEPPKLAMAG